MSMGDICYLCGKPVGFFGKVWLADRVYHKNCFERVRPEVMCPVCGELRLPFKAEGGGLACTKCHQVQFNVQARFEVRIGKYLGHELFDRSSARELKFQYRLRWVVFQLPEPVGVEEWISFEVYGEEFKDKFLDLVKEGDIISVVIRTDEGRPGPYYFRDLTIGFDYPLAEGESVPFTIAFFDRSHGPARLTVYQWEHPNVKKAINVLEVVITNLASPVLKALQASRARRHLINAVAPGVGRDFAIEELTKAVELDPMLAEAYAKRALIDLSGIVIPDYERDLADAEKAIQLDPTIVDAYFVRGWIYSDSKDIDKRRRALEDLRKVLELSPDFSVISEHIDPVTGRRRVIGPKEIRQRILACEIRIQRRGMKEMVEALISAKSLDERWLVVGILTKEPPEIVADEEGLKLLIESLGNNDPEICRAAAYVLRFWPDERAFKPLLRCIGLYGDKWQPQHAVLALDDLEEKIGKLSAVAELYTQALMDKDPVIRETASERFQTHPIIHITWLDQEGKVLKHPVHGGHVVMGFTKDTNPSVLVKETVRRFRLSMKTSEEREIKYQVQTEDGRYLDPNETLEENFKKLEIDNLSIKLKMVPREGSGNLNCST